MEAGAEPRTVPSYEEIIEKQQATREGRYGQPLSILTRYGAAMLNAGFHLFGSSLGRLLASKIMESKRDLLLHCPFVLIRGIYA